MLLNQSQFIEIVLEVYLPMGLNRRTLPMITLTVLLFFFIVENIARLMQLRVHISQTNYHLI